MIAQRERELDERDDGWGGQDIHELEARLRRLERSGTSGDGSRSFSGGFRRLEQQGTRRPPDADPAGTPSTIEGRGALAQLGEHQLCKLGVAGSSPARSIVREQDFAERNPAARVPA